MNFEELQLKKTAIEQHRQALLELKREILKIGGADCYEHLNTDYQKWIYRKVTQQLRYINKQQQLFKDKEAELEQEVVKTLFTALDSKNKLLSSKVFRSMKLTDKK